MKKLTIMLAAASIALGASAQLKVVESGQVQVGYHISMGDRPVINPLSTTATIPGGTLTPGELIESSLSPDSLATFRIIGPSSMQSGGKIAFGGMGYTYIAEDKYSYSTNRGFGSLILGAKGGLSYYCGDTKIFSHNITKTQTDGSKIPVTFTVPVSTPQVLTSSDSRLKTDIEPLENMSELLADIAPVSYRLIGTTLDESNEGGSANGMMRSAAQSNGQHQYGFLAQDVREVYPDLVYEDEDGMLSIDYTGFIPLLVDAVQGLREKVREQEQTIEALKNGTKEGGSTPDGSVVASLSQNRPNPFRTSTVVSCVLPDDVSSAFLCVYDLNGNQKLRNNITERGNVDITIEGNTLTAGMYIYTLIADGVEIDSKRMILTD